jgi:SAM-dependent methyltransferase
MSTTDIQADETAVDEFVGKVLGDMAGSMATRFAVIGEALGLWKGLATGPATSAELAARTSFDERYVREWLAGVHAAGYVTYEPASGAFTLPDAAVAVFADDGGPAFVGGDLQLQLGLGRVQDDVIRAFRTGRGVPLDDMSHDVFHGIARSTSAWFDHLLVQDWLPRLPEVEAQLEEGCDVADVGTGAGRALITLATRYPNSRFVGFDISPAQVALAEAAITDAGVGDRVRVERVDASAGLPGEYDLITTFDVIHDAVDPGGLLCTIRDALKAGGRYLCLDINASHRVEDNVGPLATVFFGYSLHYCMTTSLAAGGAGLGTCGFNPHVAERMCREAGFGEFRVIDIEHPMNHLYEATP